MEGRRIPFESLLEWAIAVLGAGALAWFLSVPVERIVGSGVEAAPGATQQLLPPGIPPGAMSVEVLLLLDGREIRNGDQHARLVQQLPDDLLRRPVVRTVTDSGERVTRDYRVNDMRFFVVCERTEPRGTFRIAGIYLP